MRRVELPGSLLAVVSAAAILVSLAASHAFADEAAASTPAPQAAAEDDYYTRRAKGILARERAADIKPHPLAARYPGYDVVVCEAGCADRKGVSIVFAKKQAPVIEAREAYMVTTSSEGDVPLANADVACVGGCYGDTESAPVPMPLVRAAAPSRTVQSKDLPRRDKLSPIR